MNLQHGSPPLGRAIRVRSGGVEKILGRQAAEAVKRPAALAGQRLGGEGRRLVLPVGFAEQGVADAAAEQEVGRGEQALGGRHATQDQMGVFGVGREELAGGFNARVARLDGDLGRREVRADQDVQVPNLGERLHAGCPGMDGN